MFSPLSSFILPSSREPGVRLKHDTGQNQPYHHLLYCGFWDCAYDVGRSSRSNRSKTSLHRHVPDLYRRQYWTGDAAIIPSLIGAKDASKYRRIWFAFPIRGGPGYANTSKATVGISYGIIGDIITPAERGHWMSIAACGPNVSPAFGPVFGGILAQEAGWLWIFLFLARLAFISLALIIVFYPKTGRNIVGNGSTPAHGLNRRAIDILRPSSLAENSPPIQYPKRKLKLPNPLLSFTLFLEPYNTPLMLIYALFYTDYCILQASLYSLHHQLPPLHPHSRSRLHPLRRRLLSCRSLWRPYPQPRLPRDSAKAPLESRQSCGR